MRRAVTAVTGAQETKAWGRQRGSVAQAPHPQHWSHECKQLIEIKTRGVKMFSHRSQASSSAPSLL